jgi:hypothetical protein
MARANKDYELPLVDRRGAEEREHDRNVTKAENIQIEKDQLISQTRAIGNRISKLEVIIQQRDLEYHELMDLKKERKKLEIDAQLLNNRIELLKKEEIKIWKKIREFTMKAAEIEGLKVKNEQRKKEKEMVKNKLDLMSRTRGTEGIEWKQRAIKTLETRKELIKNQKRNMVFKMTKEREENEKRFEYLRKLKSKENKKKIQEIKESTALGEEKKKAYTIKKQEVILRRLQSEKVFERVKVLKVKKELESLCRMEEGWMTKLKTSQKMQNKALEKLKGALNIEEEEAQQANAAGTRPTKAEDPFNEEDKQEESIVSQPTNSDQVISVD